ncbi:MAG: DNA polymerase III subunit delta [Candidatus Electryonea clarkiae]|nr:DNA polymerase III subunit delta [Candidatus Electryonea clarkiae]MDP8286071.1 DNA polymerase III subunit delta [Candidatus Electryonea clarkiae]
MGRAIDLKKFQTEIEKDSTSPVYFAYGNEPFLLDEVGRIARSQIIQDDSAEFNVDVFYGDDLSPQALSSALNALPMMSEKRVVVVKHAETLSPSSQKYLLEYLENPSLETVLFLLVEGTGKSAWHKKMVAGSVVIDCNTPKGRKLESWIIKLAEEKNVRIEDEALMMFTEGRDVRLIELSSELEKASLLAGESKVVTLDILQQVWGIESEVNIWKFFDRAASGRRRDSLRDFTFLSSDFEKDKDNRAGFTLSQISRKLRTAWKEQIYDRSRTPYSNRIWTGNTERQWKMASGHLKSMPSAVAVKSLGRIRVLDRLRKSRAFSASSLFIRLIHYIALDRERSSDGS